MSRIFQTLGASPEELPGLWIAAPLTGLLVQPIIGYWSDRTWSPKWGRRRPYFMIGAILSSAALFIMPHSSALWMAAGLLWVLDASINISMEPFRALVADKLPEDQRNFGFVLQTLIIGIGTWVASNLPWIVTQLGAKNEAPAGEIPDSVFYSFAVGAAVFFAVDGLNPSPVNSQLVDGDNVTVYLMGSETKDGNTVLYGYEVDSAEDVICYF